MLGLAEANTGGIYHATQTVLEPLDRSLDIFLRDLQLDARSAFLGHNMAPLSMRHDIAMLGFLHKRVLGFVALTTLCGTDPARTMWLYVSANRCCGRSEPYLIISETTPASSAPLASATRRAARVTSSGPLQGQIRQPATAHALTRAPPQSNGLTDSVGAVAVTGCRCTCYTRSNPRNCWSTISAILVWHRREEKAEFFLLFGIGTHAYHEIVVHHRRSRNVIASHGLGGGPQGR